MNSRSLGLLGAILLVSSQAWGEPDYEALADSIRIAEGNANYGILTHYKHTSYRQACINTCKHAWKDYSSMYPNYAKKGLKTQKNGFLAFLANRYCPVGAKNDPKGLNKHWLSNVSYYYKGGV